VRKVVAVRMDLHLSMAIHDRSAWLRLSNADVRGRCESLAALQTRRTRHDGFPGAAALRNVDKYSVQHRFMTLLYAQHFIREQV
jgi:hypothetical protein